MRYTDITELTPELLRLFIQKIVAHEKSVKWGKRARQTVEIHYTDIGRVGDTVSKDSSQEAVAETQDKEAPRQAS